MSIGIALIPEDGTDAMSLIRSADVAMYKAKEPRNSYVFFTDEINEKASERIDPGVRATRGRREAAAGAVLPAGRRRLRAHQGRRGPAALAQLQRGYAPLGQFIPIAEETGLILPIGDWVLERACRELRAWNEAGFPELYVSVNLSSRQWSRRTWSHRLLGVIRDTGREPVQPEGGDHRDQPDERPARGPPQDGGDQGPRTSASASPSTTSARATRRWATCPSCPSTC